MEVTADTIGAGCFFTPPSAKETATLTTEAITTSGDVVVIGSAKDSRGFTGEARQTISVLEYSKPLVVPCDGENAIKCYRSTENGDIKGSSPHVWIKAKRSYYNLGSRNRCVLQWRRKLSAEVWDSNNPDQKWHDLLTADETGDEYNALVSEEFILTESYAVQIRALDDLGDFDVKDIEVPTQNVALHLGAGGKNVTVGDYCDKSEEYTFRSAWKAIFDKGIYGELLPQIAIDLLTYAEQCQIGITPIFTDGNSVGIPTNGVFDYSSGFITKKSDTRISVILSSFSTGDLATNLFLDGEWQGWKYLHTTST